MKSYGLGNQILYTSKSSTHLPMTELVNLAWIVHLAFIIKWIIQSKSSSILLKFHLWVVCMNGMRE